MDKGKGSQWLNPGHVSPQCRNRDISCIRMCREEKEVEEEEEQEEEGSQWLA